MSLRRPSSAVSQITGEPASISLSSAWPPCTITAVALIAAAPSQVSCRIFRDGIRSRVFAETTLIR